MNNDNKQRFEIRFLAVVRKTLIAVAKDTITRPGLKHPLSKVTQEMITDCLDIVTSRQIAIEKSSGIHTNMKPVYTDKQTVQSFSIDDLKKTLN